MPREVFFALLRLLNSRFQDTSDVFNVQRSQGLLYVYEYPPSFSIAQCWMPTLSTFSRLNIPHQLPTSLAFPLDSKVWGVGRTCDFCGDSRLLRAGVGSVEQNNTCWVHIWEDGGRWDQVDPKWNRNINCFRWSWRSRPGMMCLVSLVIMKSGSICPIESVNLSPRRNRCSPFLVKYRLAATIRRDPSLPQICTPPVNHPVKVGATRGIPLPGLFHEGRTLADPKPSWNCRKRHVLQW